MKGNYAFYLWDSLWQDYIARVSYARTYQSMITAAGGTVANDHIAFRSLRLDVDSLSGKVNLGIDYLEAIARSLGYEAAGEYSFSETYLYARHYHHPQQEEFDLPKLFISELIVDELPSQTQQLILQTVQNGNLKKFTIPVFESSVGDLKQFFTRPWPTPSRSVVQQVNEVTQYGAWVLLHGYAVNHFTGYINRQKTSKYPDIETTARGLAELGVPMKAEIEGSTGCGLQQTATQAVTEMVKVLDDLSGEEIEIPWTYAYYELAQRHPIEIKPGKRQLFSGFLGNNAQQLFEMTRLQQPSS